METTLEQRDKFRVAIILEFNEGFLPRAIRFFMNVLRWTRGLPKRRRIHNHVEVFTWKRGENPMITGAVKGGIRQRYFFNEMPESHWDNIEFYIPKKSFTEDQVEAMLAKIDDYLRGSDHHNYEYFNFIAWIVYIFTFGKVRLSKNTDKRMECYEFGGRILNAAELFFEDEEFIDIFEYYGHEKLQKFVEWKYWLRWFLYRDLDILITNK